MTSGALVEELLGTIPTLSPMRLEVLASMVRAFAVDLGYSVDAESDFASNEFAEAFGDVLLIHHVLSDEPFTKDKFEHATVTVLNRLGVNAELAPRGNPGHDLTVGQEKWSLKTQADASIKPESIHISKFMELGRGRWDTEDDLLGLRGLMFNHMAAYDRIFTLRCLSRARARLDERDHEYELVEIPKALLAQARDFPCVMHMRSRQRPKPGDCTVTDPDGEIQFQLYFDGGTERKLQVRKLAKSRCRVHARWTFPRAEQAA